MGSPVQAFLPVAVGVIFLVAGSVAVEAAQAEGASTGGGGAIEKRLEGYDIPNVVRSRFLGWVRRSLTDRIPGEETLFKQYIDEWSFQFETLSINGITFAINIDIDGKYPYDITLLDTDCDGIFETKVEEKPGQRVDLPIPECVFRPVPVGNR